MINAVFIVWREAFEAVLIVGILYQFLRRQDQGPRPMRFMWAGVLAGLAISAVLGYAIQAAQSELAGRALEYFEVGMLLTTAFLMTHMCIWMKNHSRKIKAELEAGLRQALTTTRLIGVASLAAFAVAREGSELVMFFYGMGIEATSSGMMGQLLAGSGVGVLLTAATAWVFYRGLKFFNPRVFFSVTGWFLLITASSLVLQSTRKMIQGEILPPLRDQVWDTSWLLDERSSIGQVIYLITGYESAPALTTVLFFAVYWILTLFFYLDWSRFSKSSVDPLPSSVVRSS